MKIIPLGIACLLSFGLQAIEYEVQFENEHVHVARAKIMPFEEIDLHRDSLRQVVVALRGGVITRLEADGSKTDVSFPTGVAVFRDVDPPNEFHKSINSSTNPVDLIIIQLKKESK